MISNFKLKDFIKRFASEYINVFGILIVIINLDGSKMSNYLSLVLCVFLSVSLIICTDLKKAELFDSGFKLIITLFVTFLITINSESISNNITSFIFIFALVPLFSLNINKEFNSKNFEKIIFLKRFLNTLIFIVCLSITINEYFHEDFNLYLNLFNGVVIVSFCNLITDIYRYSKNFIRKDKWNNSKIKYK